MIDIMNMIGKAVERSSDFDDPIDAFEAGMIDTGFDFETDTMEFVNAINERVQENNEELLNMEGELKRILLRSGVTEQQFEWGNFSNAKVSIMDRRKINALQEKQSKLIDEQLGWGLFQKAIERHVDGIDMVKPICKRR